MKKSYVLFLAIIVIISILTIQILTPTIIEENKTTIEDKTSRVSFSSVFDMETVVKVQAVAGFDFDSKGRLFYVGLGNGLIKIFDNEIINFAQIPNSNIPISDDGETGPVSLKLDPKFEKNGFVYVYYSSNGTSKIGRFTNINDRGENFTIIFDGIIQGKIHNGGDIEFGPDDKLYLSTGEAHNVGENMGPTNRAHNISNKGGKILRMNRNGSIPKDNPFENLYTFAYGVRNPFGITIDSDGIVYASDNGIDCCDELSKIKEGVDHGWPFEMGIKDSVYSEPPIFDWSAKDRVAPTGLEIYTGTIYEEFYNNLFMGTWKTREIYRFVLEDNKVVKSYIYKIPNTFHETEHEEDNKLDSVKVHEAHGHFEKGILNIVQGPDGYLYFSDVNAIYKLILK